MLKDLLIIGHCCHDKFNDGFLLGGSAAYAALLAYSLGLEVEVLTSYGSDFEFQDVFLDKGIHLVVKPSAFTTCFENIEQETGRIQYIHSKAENIMADDISVDQQNMPIVFICPIADEFSPELINKFDYSLVGACIQGWLRRWGPNGLIEPKVMDWSQLQGIDILIFSEDDFDYQIHLNEILKYVDHLVVTKGGAGAEIYFKGETFYFGSFPTEGVDFTGAGDTFALAYLLDFKKHSSVESACVYAHCAASLVIENLGITKIPDQKSILDRIKLYRNV